MDFQFCFIKKEFPKYNIEFSFTKNLKKESFQEEIKKNTKGIFIAPGSIFGSNGEGYVRISLCNSETNIKKAISRL